MIAKEGKRGEIVLKEIDPLLLEQVIQFLYSDNYANPYHEDVLPESSIDDVSALGSFIGGSSSSSPITVDVVDGEDSDMRSDTEEATEASDSQREPEAEDHPTLLLHFQLYMLANYLEIATLKAAALENFAIVLGDCCEPARVIAPLQHAFESIDENYHDLRTTIFEVCSENRERVVACIDLDEMLAKEESIAWPLLKKQQLRHETARHRLEKKRNALEAQVQALELRLNHLRNKVEEAEDSNDWKRDQVDDYRTITRRWHHCEDYGTQFDARLDTPRSPGDVFVRCERCRIYQD